MEMKDYISDEATPDIIKKAVNEPDKFIKEIKNKLDTELYKNEKIKNISKEIQKNNKKIEYLQKIQFENEIEDSDIPEIPETNE